MKITAIRLRNFLTFGDRTTEIKLSGLTAIVGPNGSGKTGLLRAIEVVGNHTGDFGEFPEAYRRGGNSDLPMEIQIDAEPDDRERSIISDFLVCSCISGKYPNDEPNADLKRRAAKEILRDNGEKYFGDLCRAVTVILRAESGERPGVSFRIRSGELDLHVRYSRAKTADAQTEHNAHVTDLILDGAESDVPGMGEYLSRSRKDLPDLGGFAADPIKLMAERSCDTSFDLGTFSLSSFRSDGRNAREFVNLQNFLGERNGDVKFDTIVSELFSRSVVKMSDMRARPVEAPIGRYARKAGVENVTSRDIAPILFSMANSGDLGTMSRHDEILSAMKRMTGLDVRIQVKTESGNSPRRRMVKAGKIVQSSGKSQPNHRISVGFVADGMQVPAGLAAGGDVELLTLLTALIGQKNKILLLDEPASNLHPNRQGEVLDLMRRASEEGGNQIILTTHSPFLVDPYGRGSLWRLSRGENGTSATDAGRLLRETGTKMHDADVRSMVFQRGVIVVEGPSDKVAIEMVDGLMAGEGRGPDVAGSGWTVLAAGGKSAVGGMSRLAEKLGIQHVSAVDRDALMKREKTTTIGNGETKASAVVKYVNEAFKLSESEIGTIIEAERASGDGGGYDEGCFGALREIARSRGVYVLPGDLEDAVEADTNGRNGKPRHVLERIERMRSEGRIPEGIEDLMGWLGTAIREKNRRGARPAGSEDAAARPP